MRSPWLTICDEFRKSTRTSTFQKSFNRLRKEESTLLAFLTPTSLLEHQRSRVPGARETDAVFEALIHAYQRGGKTGAAAGTLLLLAMEPGLTTVFQRARQWGNSDEEWAGRLYLAFFEKISKWGTDNSSHIAANLKLTTLNQLFDVRKKELRQDRDLADGLRQAEALTETDEPGEVSLGQLWQCMRTSDKPYSPDEPEMEYARRLLAAELHLSQRDTDLLLLRGPCRWPWERLAGHLGMKPESARKQHRRLQARWGKHRIFQV